MQFMSISIFISHSSSDEDLAKALIRLLRAAIALSPESIRCTSVLGFKLPTGADVDAQLRNEVLEATIFIALLTEHALNSTFVLFELGARWGVKKPLFPLMTRGITGSKLNGPLRAIHARECSATEEVYQFLNDVAEALGVDLFPPHTYQSELRAFQDSALVAPSKTTALPIQSAPTPSELPLPSRGVLDLSSREICEKLRDAIPLQASDLAKEYVGYDIDWETTLSDAFKNSGTDKIGLHLHPWEPHGYDICIHCDTTLAKNPEFAALRKGTPVRLQGRIIHAKEFSIDIDALKLSVLPADPPNVTRICAFLADVRAMIGADASQSFSDRSIEEVIKGQMRMGHPQGLKLIDAKRVTPYVDAYSKKHRLLVLYSALNIIQTSKVYTDRQRESLGFGIENEIHDIENGASLLGHS
jgi:hypothetical protein